MIDVGYDAFDDPYCYSGTGVLRNKADLRDAEALEAFELEMTTLRADEPLPDGRFGPAHYRCPPIQNIVRTINPMGQRWRSALIREKRPWHSADSRRHW